MADNILELLQRINFANNNVLLLGSDLSSIKQYINDKSNAQVSVYFYSNTIQNRLNSHQNISSANQDLNLEKNSELDLFLKEKGPFNIVILVNFLDIIPFPVLNNILVALYKNMTGKSIIICNTLIHSYKQVTSEKDTPNFKILKNNSCKIDELEPAKYTKESLTQFFKYHNYGAISGQIFGKDFPIKPGLTDTQYAWEKAIKFRYSLRGDWKATLYKYAEIYESPLELTKHESPLNKYPDYDFSSLSFIHFKDFSMYTTRRLREFYNPGFFENFTTDLLKSFIREENTILDIGAHHGYYSLIASNLVGKRGKVFAFEPVKENYFILLKNVSLNKFRNVECWNSAISDNNCEKDFYISKASDSSGFTPHPLSSTVEKRLVQTYSIDEFFNDQKIDIIKIDTEGHELSILKGAKNTIRKNDNIILIVEFNPICIKNTKNDPIDLLDKLDSYDFDIFFINDNERQLYRFDTSSPHNYPRIMNGKEYVNLLCIKKSKSLFVNFLSHSASKYGAERSLLEEIDNLLKKQILIHVTLPHQGLLLEELLVRNVSYDIIPLPWWIKNSVTDFEEYVNTVSSSLRKAISAISLRNPEILYTSTSVIPQGGIVARLLNKPHIWHIHEFGIKEYGIDYILKEKQLKTFINDHSHEVIFTSNVLKESYHPFIDDSKVNIIYNFVSILKPITNNIKTRSYYSTSQSLKILSIGHIDYGKNAGDLVKAVSIIKKMGSHEVELIIVGSVLRIEYFNEINQFIYKNDLVSNIKFIDYIDNLYNLFEEADILVSTSKLEAFGRTIIEAMMHGKIVIGANSGATKEFIKDGINGFLYTPGNPGQLAEKILAYANNTNNNARMRHNAKQFISEKMNPEKLTDKLFELLNKTKKLQDDQIGNQKNINYYGKFITSLFQEIDLNINNTSKLLKTKEQENNALSRTLNEKERENGRFNKKNE